MTELCTMQVVSPVAKSKEERVPLAPRPLELKDRRLGLLENGKPNAIPLAEAIANPLLEHYPEERAKALEQLDFTIAEFPDTNMQPTLECALRHNDILKA